MSRLFFSAALVLTLLTAPALRAEEAATESKDQSKSKSKFETATSGARKSEGLWTVYSKDQQVLVDLKNSQFDHNYIVLTSIARGISSGMVLGGMSWGFGDDIVWSFRKVGDKVHVLRRNVRFKAKQGTPEANAVKFAYSDSVLYALPIVAESQGGQLVDFTRVFLSDDQQIGRYIGAGSHFVQDRSTVSKVKSYPKNVEFQIAAVYSGQMDLDTVADSRGAQIHVHYSISELPSNGYKPRVADDRIGYFLTVTKDFSDTSDDQHFVRYVNRWDLKKKDSSLKLSPPEEPITFWIEKTVPIRLRPTVQAGIEEWNKAFEKIGFYRAIKVEQQPDDADWDPEDIRYNTFRWITAEAGFAMGPSRVNPLTGQILDADIIFDASFLRHWKQDYETFTPASVAALMGGDPLAENDVPFKELFGGNASALCTLNHGMQQQLGFAAAALTAQGAISKKGELPEEFVHQALKEVVMHEVGHTLGLRHNFKASAWKSLKDLEGMKDEATVGSVMDYSPVNICPEGSAQGAYYTPTIGPYDYWAIEYGYKPISGDEKAELRKIASRGNEPGLDYATDENTRGSDSDPLANRFDLGSDPISYAKRQMAVASSFVPKILDRTVEDGDGYQRARQAFGMLLSEYWRTAYFASRVPGGIYVNRDHKGGEKSRPPFEVVEASKQRDAMKLLAETAFASPKYESKLLNYLAPTYWSHWGLNESSRLDYPLHDTIEMMHSRILSQLLSSLTLRRLQDSELKVAADADVYTTAEHLRLLADAVFSEWKDAKAGEYTNRNPYISSFRRNLQRMTVRQFGTLVTEGSSYSEDARVLARMHLTDLNKQIDALLKKEDLKLDDYTKAHLLDSQSRIQKILDAQLTLRSVN